MPCCPHDSVLSVAPIPPSKRQAAAEKPLAALVIQEGLTVRCVGATVSVEPSQTAAAPVPERQRQPDPDPAASNPASTSRERPNRSQPPTGFQRPRASHAASVRPGTLP